MIPYVANLFWRTTKVEITAALKSLSPMLPSVGSGVVGRKVENGGTKHGMRRRQSRGISRWGEFLRTWTRGGLGGLDCHRRNGSRLLTLF